MGNVLLTDTKSKFDWDDAEEPHKKRRIEIINAHPEIKKLMVKKGDPFVAFIGLAIAIVHVLLGIAHSYLTDRPSKSLFIALLGPTFATLLILHGHEAAHGLIFGPNRVWLNKLYGMLVMLPLGAPLFTHFKRHHKKHHKYLGDETMDSEYPSEYEARLFSGRSPGVKYIFILLNPAFAYVRNPVFIFQKSVWEWNFDELLEHTMVCALDIFLLYTGRIDLIIYLMFSTLLGLSTHMFGFWGAASHIQFLKHKETSSYYGWMNKVFMNFGHHMEHHDFPGVPYRCLPQIKKLAPEYYEDSFQFDSFYSAIIKFLFDPKLGINSRLKRSDNHYQANVMFRKGIYNVSCCNNSMRNNVANCG